MTNKERITKLRDEVQSLRDLLDRTQNRRNGKAHKSEEKLPKLEPKPRVKTPAKPDNDIPPF